MLKKILLIFLLFSSLAVSAKDFVFNEANKKAYNSYLKLKISEGDEWIKIAKEKTPNNGINLYIENMGDIARLLISEDEKEYTSMSKRQHERLQAIKKMDNSSPYYLFTQAEIKIHWSLVKLKFGKLSAAALDAKSAHGLLVKNLKLHPKFLLTKKSLANFEIAFGAIPQKYKWAADIVGAKGSTKKGLKYYDEVAIGLPFYKNEVTAMKHLLEVYVLNKKEKAFYFFSKKTQQEPDNLLFHLLYISILNKDNQSNNALKAINKLPNLSNYPEVVFLHYIKGELYMELGNYAKAIPHLKYFASHFKGKNYIKDTYFKLFIIYWLENNKELSQYYKTLALSKGKTLVEPDKQAEKTLKSSTLPHKEIYKARLLFDGGEYQKSLNILNNIPVFNLTNNRDKVECIYRKGRANHRLKEYKNALVYYNVAQRHGKILPYYFGANAALQSGYIYRDIYKDKIKAKIAFKQVLTYNRHEYKGSLDTKAKAALKALDN